MQHDPKAMGSRAGYSAGSVTDLRDEPDLASRLRADIISGDFRPDTRLKFADLTKRYGVGVGTIREALTHLTSEGFVALKANKGFSVSPISAEELMEVTELYIELEKRAVANAIAYGDDVWEGQIVSAHHRLRTIECRPWEERVARHSEWVSRHREFHESMVAACQGPWLLRLRSLMFDQLERYRFLTKMAPKGMGGQKRDEHQKIMDAVLERNVDKVTGLIDAHIRDTTLRAVTLMENLEMGELA